VSDNVEKIFETDIYIYIEINSDTSVSCEDNAYVFLTNIKKHNGPQSNRVVYFLACGIYAVCNTKFNMVKILKEAKQNASRNKPS
jgi:hypothetical protein